VAQAELPAAGLVLRSAPPLVVKSMSMYCAAPWLAQLPDWDVSRAHARRRVVAGRAHA
jgi:hypothetical protein